MLEKKSQTKDRPTLKVQERNSKSITKWNQQENQNNLNSLPNLYNVEIQKTYPKFQSRFKSVKAKLCGETETEEQQYQISELIRLHSQLESINNEENNQKAFQPLFDYFELMSCQMDFLIQIRIENNQLTAYSGQLYYPQIGIELENAQKIQFLADKMKDCINSQKIIVEKLAQELNQLESQRNEIKQKINPINEEIFPLQNQLNSVENQNFFLSKQQNKKFFQLSILQEQFNCFKRCSKQVCILVQKQKVYDQNYEPYYTIRNQKYLEINSKVDQQILMSENKKSQAFQQKNGNRFDQIIHRKQFVNEDLYQDLLRHTQVFFIQILCKSIKNLYKSYPFNSNEISAIFDTHRVAEDQLMKINQALNQDKKCPENQDSIVVYIVRKPSDFFLQFVVKVIGALKSFENQFCSLQDLNVQQNILNIKEDSIRHISQCSLKDCESQLNKMSLNASDCEIIQIKLEIKLKLKLQRNIHFLYIIQEKITNQEAFCRQFKDCYKKKKGLKDQIGSVLESIIKNADKYLIITEMPEMIKMTCNQQKKLAQLKNLIHFSQTMATKRQ
ncbi:unnamed protein product (macronuclear) [Paramecium tetraurelia]|uniref:Uncharacterized protein n=1 Tax=Paramecium tetraurelia TaxID=5888 RepID=A0E9A8_PARTE|nr:uncharacterized protein GSPATT00024606001 [Paramecium tetraurelia]CAK91875.1 unnamed protein product [Paramecium tetraurelia]|eukprot:XP_001459272.1 hypothetical protein (macronuclear) [Paramecium tetraurelia strain d4-2]